MNLAIGVLVLAAQAAATRPTWAASSSRSPFDDSPTLTYITQASKAITAWPRQVVRPVLVVRCKEGNLDVYIRTGLVANPEIGSYDQATFRIRWDAEPSETTEMGEASSDEAYFFRDAEVVDALAKILRHRRLLIGFVPFKSDPVDTTFTLPGLERHLDTMMSACSSVETAVRIKARLWRKPRPGQLAGLIERLGTQARWDALKEIRMMGPAGATAVPALLKALDGPALEIGAPKDELVEALGLIGPAAGPGAITAIEAFVVKWPPAKLAAINAIAEIRGLSAAKGHDEARILEHMKSLTYSGATVFQRLHACEQLTAMGTAASAYQTNIKAIADGDEDLQVRQCAAKLLVEIAK